MNPLTEPQKQVLDALYAGGRLQMQTAMHSWVISEANTMLFPVAVNTFRSLARRKYIQHANGGYIISDTGCEALGTIPLSEAHAGL